MLELLASGGKTRGAMYPDSGPGSKELSKGNEELGYFDTLPSSSFLTTSELSSLTGIDSGTVRVEDLTWIKLMMKGKVLFIPTTFIRGPVPYQTLYDAGGVYGEDGNGKYPLGGGVKQDLIISVKNSNFRVRLFGRGDTDPDSSAGGSIMNYQNYEFGIFLTAIFKPPSSNTAFSNSWNLVSDWGMVTGRNFSMMTTHQSNLNKHIVGYIGNAPNVELWNYVKTVNVGYWWPVLELLNADIVLPIKNVTNDVSRILLPIAPGEITTEGEYVKPVINRYGYTTDYLLQGALTELTYEKPTDWAVPIPVSSIRQGSLIPISVSSMTVEQ